MHKSASPTTILAKFRFKTSQIELERFSGNQGAAISKSPASKLGGYKPPLLGFARSLW
jgi:hypothetical protein